MTDARNTRVQQLPRPPDGRSASPPRSGVRRLCAILAAAATLGALVATDAYARPNIERYVNFSVSPASLDLGSVTQPGIYDSPSELTVHVMANCVHGGVVASVTPLVLAGGGSIDPQRVFVKLSPSGNYVPMTNPIPVTGPMNPGAFDVILKFWVQTTLADVPGQYTGTLTITCSAAP